MPETAERNPTAPVFDFAHTHQPKREKMKHAQIHRRGEKIAISIPTSETVYLTTKQAVAIAEALYDAAFDVLEQPFYSKSQLATQIIALEDLFILKGENEND